MSKKKTETEEVIEKIFDYTLEDIMGERFGSYSKYIIQDRAIPDARDGLKPVQRRILYSMHKERNTYDKAYRKSAKTVGDVMGNYHPHGDTSIYDAMVGYGLDPEVISEAKWAEGSIGSFLELHIEQGPVLDAEKIELGLVDCIVGIQRYMVTVHGRADHAGTTPMDMRLDAVDAATKVISKIADWAREKGAGTVATTGYIKTTPGGMNIVAEKVEFTVDIRSTNNDYINDIAGKIRVALDYETTQMGGSYEMDSKLTITPVHLSEEMLQIMEDDCKEKGYSYKRLPSGAGHDALEIGQVIPPVMLFVPSKDGRSHCPVEHTENEDFTKAVDIVVDMIKSFQN